MRTRYTSLTAHANTGATIGCDARPICRRAAFDGGWWLVAGKKTKPTTNHQPPTTNHQPPTMEIELKTCVIRPWRPGDEESLVAHANNYNVWRNMRDRFPHPYTADDAREWIRHTGEESPRTNFAIVVDGEAAGGIGLVLNGDIHRCSAEIGYGFAEAFWVRRFVTDAVRT